MIPQVIHRLWLGPRPMPHQFRVFGRLWEHFNPGWKTRDWSWHDLPEDLANQDVMDDLRRRCTRGDSIELPTALADVIDYELVARFGGIYVNCDIQPVRPLLPEMVDGLNWASWEEPQSQFVVNAAFGGPAGHPFWVQTVHELNARYWNLRKSGNGHMNHATGPHLLTSMYQAHPGLLHVFPSHSFNPVYWADIPLGGNADGMWREGNLPGGTVGVHHWDHRRTGRGNVVA
jgi:mannosyltransferase OCH1-like enzyme